MKTKLLLIAGALAISIALMRPASIEAFDMCADQEIFDTAGCDFSNRSCIAACESSYPPGPSLDQCESGCGAMHDICSYSAGFDFNWCETPTFQLDFCGEARALESDCLAEYQSCASGAGSITDVLDNCSTMYMQCRSDSHIDQCE